MASTVEATAEYVENGSAAAPGSDSQTLTSDAMASETITTATAATGGGKTESGAENENPPLSASELVPAETAAPAPETAVTEKKWPGWPGDCVFRLVVPVLKVGSIIGRKGDLIKKMCEETRARIRILDGPVGSPDRIVSRSLGFLVFLMPGFGKL
ncbi:hypothetical protein U1Q18_045228 [Sarracenia purpurea var. burkii]